MRLISHCSPTLVPAEVKSHSPKRQDTHTHTHTHTVSPHPTPLPCAFTVRINTISPSKFTSNAPLSTTSQTGFFPWWVNSGILFTLSCILSSWGQRLDFTSSWISLHLPHSTLNPSMPCKKSPINHYQWLFRLMCQLISLVWSFYPNIIHTSMHAKE